MNFIQKFIDYCEQSYLDIKKNVKVASPLQLAGTGGQHRSVALTERVGAELKRGRLPCKYYPPRRLKRKETLIALNENLSNS